MECKFLKAVIVGLFFTTSCVVNAGLIIVKVEGQLSQIDPVFSGLVNYGDKVHAIFQYDSASITRTSHFEPHRAFHYLSDFSYYIEMGTLTFSGNGGRAEVTNNHIDTNGRLWDRFILQRGGVGTIDSSALDAHFDIANIAAGVSFYDFFDADALSDTALSSIVSLDKFGGSSHVTIQMNLDDGVFDWLPMFARISSSEIIYVPEPDIVFAFLFGICLIVIRRH
jgi:hypothetical protein